MSMALLVMGVSGAGKTTVGRLLAERLGCRFLDADDFHPESNVRKMASGQPLTDEDRWPWLEALAKALGPEPRVVLACSALKEAYRARLREARPDLRIVWLDAPPEAIRGRVLNRSHPFMPASLLESQFRDLEPPQQAVRVDATANIQDVIASILDQLEGARMTIGVIGLGRMGRNIALRLQRDGHTVVGHDASVAALDEAQQAGVATRPSLKDLLESLPRPRRLWVMVPAGEPTETTLRDLKGFLTPGDSVVDGGNSNYEDSIRRASDFRRLGIGFLDVGTSGGIWGLDGGYCLMIGGDETWVGQWLPVFRSLAPRADAGWVHVGPSGAGHYAKMVHNAVEYGMMQALAEGLELLRAKPLVTEVASVVEAWRHGSVVRSWLLDLAAKGLRDEPDLASLAPHVEDSGEGRWAVQESVRLGVPAPVLAASLYTRFASRQQDSFALKALAMLRREFGGHSVRRKDDQR
ncbi:MAG: decarboxylating 6-phosphogluconate dehydrogenase [Fimbriimonadales bacterium]|nr:decarboxylating 6-phosphogluconate dehydrogenase [Fimbriimonadales bacterium]